MSISISAGVLLFVILAIGMGCLAKYGKLKNLLCCSVSWKGEEIVRNVVELIREYQGRATNDTVLEEMIPTEKQGQ